MGEVKLNLARKWRSKQFEEIVGQDLSVRMLKNSLYLQHYFPVYLFSGQRGCGKTSTARVFATALNCEKLSEFQENPQGQPLPCLKCGSCSAMAENRHPDFIEIDAASHTGVDHVRTLIDSATMLPLMGNKKIYLIDEAHMLSKAAFNALLKLLEEPPPSVLFMLATTDPQKIIDTVRSRCFQLFFRPVDLEVLQKQLQLVCTTEQIAYEDAGLAVIVKQTEGSVRDALNLLEQVRFSSKTVSHDAVLQTLGYVDDASLIQLFKAVLCEGPGTLLQTIQDMGWQRYSAHIMWVRMLELVRAALWLKYNVAPDAFQEHHDTIKKISSNCTAHQLTQFLQIMYDNELLFAKTTAKHDFFEMILLQICSKVGSTFEGGGNTPASSQPTLSTSDADQEHSEDLDDESEDDDEDEEQEDAQSSELLWKQFVQSIESFDDPLLVSVFAQGVVKNHDITTGVLTVEFSKEFTFFTDWLSKAESSWMPLLKKQFGENVRLDAQFTGTSAPIKKRTIERTPSVRVAPQQAEQKKQAAPQQHNRAPFKRRATATAHRPVMKETTIDISDTTMWEKTHRILRYFPGTVTQVQEQ